MQPKTKIRFLDDVEVLAQGEVSFSAKSGEVVEMVYPSANRWIKRNLAEIYVESKAEQKVETSAEPETKPAPAKKRTTRRKTTKDKTDLEG